MNFTCLNESEEKLHQGAIRALERETHIPERDIGPVYESVLQGFVKTARVRDFLPILVSREVKDILLHRIHRIHSKVSK